MKIIGRKKEQELLKNYVDDVKSNFIVVTGRRRIGKTFLIREFFENNFAFHFFGIKDESETAMFARLSHECFNNEKIENWNQAFIHLANQIKNNKSNQKKVIFLDELPWMAKTKKDLIIALDYFWNSFISFHNDVLLIVCGSSASWITNNILKNTGGLHNRITGKIVLSPFTLKETEDYFNNRNIVFNRFDILEIYNVLGGVPYYLDKIQRSLSVSENINNLFFQKNAQLKDEFFELYSSLFKNYNDYIRIIKLLAESNKGLTKKELVEDKLIFDNGHLSDILLQLELCGFISKYNNFPNNKNNSIFQLIDNFSIFYLKYVNLNNSYDEHFWLNNINTPKYYSWNGYAFERTCLLHLEQIKYALGISGISTYTYSFQNKSDQKIQVDLLIYRADKAINLCEIKNTAKPYVLDKEEYLKIQRRKDIFNEYLKKNERIVLTLISAKGINNSNYSYIFDKVVDLDDLFNF
jgi:AAA+ ATPase superfamily predicted ATPase